MKDSVEGVYPGEYILEEVSLSLCRESITIASGNKLLAGQVLGMITTSGKYAKHDPSKSDGSEMAVAVLVDGVDATEADKKGVASVRLTLVNINALVFKAGILSAEKTAALESLKTQFIITR